MAIGNPTNNQELGCPLRVESLFQEIRLKGVSNGQDTTIYINDFSLSKYGKTTTEVFAFPKCDQFSLSMWLEIMEGFYNHSSMMERGGFDELDHETRDAFAVVAATVEWHIGHGYLPGTDDMESTGQIVFNLFQSWNDWSTEERRAYLECAGIAFENVPAGLQM